MSFINPKIIYFNFFILLLHYKCLKTYIDPTILKQNLIIFKILLQLIEWNVSQFRVYFLWEQHSKSQEELGISMYIKLNQLELIYKLKLKKSGKYKADPRQIQIVDKFFQIRVHLRNFLWEILLKHLYYLKKIWMKIIKPLEFKLAITYSL